MLLACGIGLCGWWCFRGLSASSQPRIVACTAAITASFAASVLQSIADFVWYIPALMSITAILAACALRLAELAQPIEKPPAVKFAWTRSWAMPQQLSAGLAGAVLLVGIWMTHRSVCTAMTAPDWDEVLRYDYAQQGQSHRQLGDDTLLNHAREVVRWNPTDARAHVRAASLCLQRFDELQARSPNPMPLSQIRDAALASAFPSRKALDEWLGRAVGEHRLYLDEALTHIRSGLKQCPLIGEGYIYLAELCFLEGAPASAKALLVNQALQVRPYDGQVLTAAGAEAALAGNADAALEFWGRAFHSDLDSQRNLLTSLRSAGLPPGLLVERFKPDLGGLKTIYLTYRDGTAAEFLQPVVEAYVAAAEDAAPKLASEDAAQLWLELNEALVAQGASEEALDRARRAVTAAPNHFMARATLGKQLLAAGKCAEAVENLTWCASRRPDDAQILDQLTAARRGQASAVNPRTGGESWKR